MTKPKLQLTGNSGNAFVILANAQRIAEANDMDWKKIEAEAESGDYNHLLNTMRKYFNVK